MTDKVEKIDTLKDRAIEMLGSLIDAATQAGEFIKGQVPMVIRELLVYHTALYVFWVIAMAALTTASVLWLRHCFKKHKSWEDDWMMAAVPGWILGPIGVVGFCVAITNLMQITLAPRVWLIEYAAGLVR